MLQLLAFIILTLPVFCWTIYRCYKQQRTVDITLLSMLYSCLVCDMSIIWYNMTYQHLPSAGIELFGELCTMVLVPTAYTYFSVKLGRAIKTSSTILGYSLILLRIFDGLTIQLGQDINLTNSAAQYYPNHLMIYDGDQLIMKMLISDFVLILQSLLVIVRTCTVYYMVKRNGLHVNKDMKYFAIWATFGSLLILLVSIPPVSFYVEPMYVWFFFIIFILIANTGLLLIAYGFDLRPILNAQGEEVKLDNIINNFDEISEQIKHLFNDEKVYLNQDIHIEDVADRISTNRTYISKIIKRDYNVSFTEFVNQFRIDEAKRVMLSDDKLLQEEIATRSGFSSASSFCRTFKRMTGVTPYEWYRSEKKNNNELLRSEEVDVETTDNDDSTSSK